MKLNSDRHLKRMQWSLKKCRGICYILGMDCSLHSNDNHEGNESHVWLEQDLCESPYTYIVTTVLNTWRSNEMQESGWLHCDTCYYYRRD